MNDNDVIRNLVKMAKELVAVPDAIDELELYLVNDKQLFSRYHEPIIKKLLKLKEDDRYNRNLALRMFNKLVDYAAEKYAKEFGKSSRDLFSIADRKDVAKSLVNRFESEYSENESEEV